MQGRDHPFPSLNQWIQQPSSAFSQLNNQDLSLERPRMKYRVILNCSHQLGVVVVGTKCLKAVTIGFSELILRCIEIASLSWASALPNTGAIFTAFTTSRVWLKGHTLILTLRGVQCWNTLRDQSLRSVVGP